MQGIEQPPASVAIVQRPQPLGERRRRTADGPASSCPTAWNPPSTKARSGYRVSSRSNRTARRRRRLPGGVTRRPVRAEQGILPDEQVGAVAEHDQPRLVVVEPRLEALAARGADRVLRGSGTGLEAEIGRAAIARVDLDEGHLGGGPERLDRQVAGQPDRRAQPDRRRGQLRVPDGHADDRFSVDDGDPLAWDARDRPALEVDEHVDRELGCLHERLDERLFAEGFDRLDGGRERRRVVDAGRAATALAEPRLDERRVADAGRIVVDRRGGSPAARTASTKRRLSRHVSTASAAETRTRVPAASKREAAPGEDRQLFVAGRDDQADPIVVADPQQRRRRTTDRPSAGSAARHRRRRAPRRADRYRPR